MFFMNDQKNLQDEQGTVVGPCVRARVAQRSKVARVSCAPVLGVCSLCGCAAHAGPCDWRASMVPLKGGDADECYMYAGTEFAYMVWMVRTQLDDTQLVK